MATHDYVIANQSGAAFRTDLNNALAAIVSNNSSASEPATKYAYMWWADTSTGILKIRNSSNDGWVELLQLDGTLTLEDGTVSAPGLAFRDDLNTGIFSSAADTFNVATGGVERMELGATTIFNESGADVDFRIEGNSNANLFYVDAGNDRIGIGASSPSQTLEVVGNIGINANLIHNGDTDTMLSFSADNQVDIQCSSALIARFTTNGIATGLSKRIDFKSANDERSGAIANADSGAAALSIQADPDQSRSGSFMNFLVDASEAMRIDSSKNLLVGTSSSRTVGGAVARLLQVDGDDGSAGISIIRNQNSASPPALSLGKQRSGSSGGNTIVNDDDNLGIIQFCGADGTDVQTVAASISGLVDGTPGANDMPGRLVFNTTADGASSVTERMRISSAGFINLNNQTDIGAILAVTANGVVNASAHLICKFNYNSTGDVTAIEMRHARGGLSGFSGKMITFTGNDSTEEGSIVIATTTTLYNTSSDYRLKENETAISDGISKIKQLKPYRFNFKKDPDVKVDGFFAHEVASVVPVAVTGEKDAMKPETRYVEGDTIPSGKVVGDPKTFSTTEIEPQQLDHSKLVPILVAAVQELISKVETLEAA